MVLIKYIMLIPVIESRVTTNLCMLNFWGTGPPQPPPPKKKKKKQRLDDAVLELHPEYSKNIIQSFIIQGKVSEPRPPWHDDDRISSLELRSAVKGKGVPHSLALLHSSVSQCRQNPQSFLMSVMTTPKCATYRFLWKGNRF